MLMKVITILSFNLRFSFNQASIIKITMKSSLCLWEKEIKMKIDPQLLEFAKSMRYNATDEVHLMWQILRAKRFTNLKLEYQH